MFDLSRRPVASLFLAAMLAVSPALAGSAGMPNAESIVMLIRSSLLTLNDALLTGNFTVLRDISAPGFREANSAAHLSQSFSDLTRRGIDLSAVATMAPELTEALIDPKINMLRVKGTFPDQPLQIDFELLFQPVAGYWRLFGLSVQPKDAAGAKATATTAPRGSAGEPGAKTTPANPTRGKESDSKK
jgi:hypothetical protein